MNNQNNISVTHVPIESLNPAPYNPRKWSADALKQLSESLSKYDMVDPLIVNSAPERKNVVIGGHFRLKVAKDLGMTSIPVVYVTIPDIEREKELNIRLNRNTGDWDWAKLAEFSQATLADIGFTSEELDDVFGFDDNPEQFDLQKELQKLNITSIDIQKQQIYELGDSRLMCGDSTVEADVRALMGDQKADMCFTDPPYILDYLNGKKKHGKATEGFGNKRDRRYLETDVLPPDFTEKWMANIAKIQKEHFSIIVYENWNT